MWTSVLTKKKYGSHYTEMVNKFDPRGDSGSFHRETDSSAKKKSEIAFAASRKGQIVQYCIYIYIYRNILTTNGQRLITENLRKPIVINYCQYIKLHVHELVYIALLVSRIEN